MAKINWSKHNYHNDVASSKQADYQELAYQRDIERSRLKFGKHRGKLIQEVPTAYLKWVLSTWQPESQFKKAMIDNARHELSQRQNIASSEKRKQVENPKRSFQDANKH